MQLCSEHKLKLTELEVEKSKLTQTKLKLKIPNYFNRGVSLQAESPGKQLHHKLEPQLDLQPPVLALVRK